MPDKLAQILKFHERVISALILVASFARPKISSQLLRVNESLKFALRNKTMRKFKFYSITFSYKFLLSLLKALFLNLAKR